MSKLTEEQYRMYDKDDGNYAVLSLTMTVEHMEKAELFIDKIRSIHRDLGDKFVGHYCMCTPRATYWKFVYAVPHESDECDEIFAMLEVPYKEVMAEMIANGDASVNEHRPNFDESLAEACVCPLDLR